VKRKEQKQKMREMTPLELNEKLKEAKEEYFNLRFQRGAGQLENFSRLKQAKHQIARINTLIKEKALEAVK